MNKIIIAYHAYLYGPNYMKMIDEQLRKIYNPKFYDNGKWERNVFPHCDKMYIGVVDSAYKHPPNGTDWISKWFEDGAGNNKVEVVIYPDNKEETNTLKWIRDYSRDNPGDFILYFHTKGITRYSSATESWRRYMEYFVIENWKDCIARLKEGYDCCGVLWNTDTPIGLHPHFSGGMWWANTNYINTLDYSYLDHPWRFMREFWIGSNSKVKVFEFHNSRLNDKQSLIDGRGHYDVEYPRINYEKK